MQRTSHHQPYYTYSKDNSKDLEGLKGKLRMYLEKISLDLEEEKELGYNRDNENNSKTNFGDRWRTVHLRHRLAEGIWPCKLDQINTDPKENWYRLAWKKID